MTTTTTPVTSARRTVAWIPFGPASPSSPVAPMRVYAAIQAGCTTTIVIQEGMRGDEAAFWQAVAHTCAALRGKPVDDAEWLQAKQAWFSDGGSGYTGGGCLGASARSFMRSVTEAAGPSFDSSLVSLSGSPAGYACTPRNLHISPDRGPAGTKVTITWENASWLGTAGQGITFGDKPAGLDGETASSATLNAPLLPDGADPAATVPVRFDFGSHGQLNAGQFSYEPESAASPAESPS